MIVITGDSIHGREVTEMMGLVRGSSIRTRHVFHDMTEWMRNLVGAELHHYTKMMAEAREQALDRMIDHARKQGADAILMMRFTTSSIASGASEMLAYGTAVRMKTNGDEPET